MHQSPLVLAQTIHTAHTCLSSSVSGWQACSSSIFCTPSGMLNVMNAKLLQVKEKGGRGGEGAIVTSRPWQLASPAQPGRQSTHRPRTPLSRFTWHSRTSPNGSASWRSSSAGRAETAHTLASPPLSPSSLAHLQSPCCAAHSRTPCWEGKRAHHPSTQHAAHHVRQTGLTKTLPSGRSSPRPPASRPRLCRSVPPPPCSPAPPPLHSAPAPPRAADQWIPPLLLRA